MSKICPASMAECYRSCSDVACRASGWEDPLTGKMPAGYKVPPEPPITTHDHNPRPVGKHPALGAPFTGEAISMKEAMQSVLDTVQPDPGDGELYGKPAYQQAAEVIDRVNKANLKHAAGSAKTPLHLVPGSALIYEALVFELGAKKYGPFNWRDSSVVRSIYLDAAMRHLLALMDGQDIDEESGYPHEAHVRACMAIIIDARELGKLIDDRPTGGNVADILRRFTKPRGYPFDGAR